MPALGDSMTSFFICAAAAAGFAFAIYWWKVAEEIKIDPAQMTNSNDFLTEQIKKDVFVISQRVSDGATSFLMAEYKYLAVFMGAFGAVLYFMLGASLAHPTEGGHKAAAPYTNAALSVAAFVLGAGTSVAAGWIGMRIAVFTNSRTAVMATEGAAEGDQSQGFCAGFETAFRGGITMGFALTSMGLFSLFVCIKIVGSYYGKPEEVKELYECVASFGLGGSAIACFGRVGGGIYTKAADVGADLVGKVEKNIPEDDARNPGVIADCIGDNVGDIAGMGSDLFGSFGEASCAALVIAAASPELSVSFTAMMYPLTISAGGIMVCIGTAMLAARNSGVKQASDIEPVLKKQLLVSTIAATVVVAIISDIGLPETFTIGTLATTKWRALVCVLTGLWSGLFIGYTTEYYTSSSYRPVREISEACETGAATNIIYGLALGYISVLPSCFAMSITIYTSYRMCGLYGYALAALGILSTMCVGLTIDAYGPISDNAGGFAEMAHMGPEIRFVTDALDAAGNTTAAIGKGFAIASAAFVGLALYGAFVTRVGLK
eukprot:101765_1